jgi:cytochrome c peroxidase
MQASPVGGHVEAGGDATPSIQPTAPAASTAFYANRFERVPEVASMREVGRSMFFDRSLSASGKQSCASCHDPRFAFGPPNAMPVQVGGADMRQTGVRAVPSLRYSQAIPPFTEHFHDSDGDDSVDQGPAGGRTWDGRAQSAHDQARLPLLSPLEMANASPAEVVTRLAAAPYAAMMRATFGPRLFDDPSLAFDAALMALEVFQQSAADFYPFDSKYDAFLRGEAELSPQETRGLALFNDPSKGNCAVCHPSAMKRGAFPAFTDYGYAALGVPRNDRIAANRDAAFADLGLCGPLRTDLAERAEYCGLFRTPTLRNVALRKSFFHNGVFHELNRVLAFYAQRSTAPERWYRRDARGQVQVFDDLPARYAGNVDRDAPFDRGRGAKPALDAREMRDIEAFLRTLTDGYGSRSLATR